MKPKSVLLCIGLAMALISCQNNSTEVELLSKEENKTLFDSTFSETLLNLWRNINIFSPA